MRIWRTACLVSFGALIGIAMTSPSNSGTNSEWCGMIFGVSILGWGWLSLGAAAQSALARLTSLVTGSQVTPPRTTPQALAAEMAALNAQISQLRDTATSFDVSFDQTLQRLDERLRRIEQRSPDVRVHPRA